MEECKQHVMKYRVTDSLCRCEVCNGLYTSVIAVLPTEKISQCQKDYENSQMVAE